MCLDDVADMRVEQQKYNVGWQPTGERKELIQVNLQICNSSLTMDESSAAPKERSMLALLISFFISMLFPIWALSEINLQKICVISIQIPLNSFSFSSLEYILQWIVIKQNFTYT